MYSHSALRNKRIAVLLPICDNDKNSINSKWDGTHVNYESSVETTCFSKPIISFTINSLEKFVHKLLIIYLSKMVTWLFYFICRIRWINSIYICSRPCRLEQIKELMEIYLIQSERIKYLTTQTNLINGGVIYNSHHHTNNNQHQQSNAQYASNAKHERVSFNRLLKYSLNHLKREDDFDIIIVHDIRMPYVEEEVFYGLTLEAVKHGVCSMATSESMSNFFFKVEENSGSHDDLNVLDTSSGGFLDECINSSIYRMTHKPQAFQFSIFQILIENVT